MPVAPRSRPPTSFFRLGSPRAHHGQHVRASATIRRRSTTPPRLPRQICQAHSTHVRKPDISTPTPFSSAPPSAITTTTRTPRHLGPSHPYTHVAPKHPKSPLPPSTRPSKPGLPRGGSCPQTRRIRD